MGFLTPEPQPVEVLGWPRPRLAWSLFSPDLGKTRRCRNQAHASRTLIPVDIRIGFSAKKIEGEARAALA